MGAPPPKASSSGAVAGFSLLILVLCAIWANNFLLFHTLAEMFSVVVGFAACVVAWYSRDWIGRNYLLLLGLSNLFVGGVDTIHTLGYKGLNIFENHGGNLSTQLWLSARLIEGVSLLVAVWSPQRQFRVEVVLTVLSLVTVALVGSAFADVWPLTFIEGQGVTSFKMGFELVLAGLFLVVLIRLRRRATDFDPQIYTLLVLCVAAKILTELSFSGYSDLYGLANFIGHGLKIISAWLFLKAVVDSGLRRPQSLIFGAMEREKALSDEVSRHATTLDAVLYATVDPVIMFDASGRIRFLSRAGEQFFGRTSRELAARTWREGGLPEDIMVPLERLSYAVLDQAAPMTEEIMLSARRGCTCLELQVSPVAGENGPGAVVACIRDVTVRKAMEEDLKSSLNDNRVLMMEVHHRVKNNLQIVSSILQMQGWRMTDPALRRKFEEACGRILSLAKVHELLYTQESVSSVDFVLYVRTLCGDLFRMYGVREDWVRLEVEAGSLPLAVDRAEPLALIVHELVSDALKHAFSQQGGCLTIRMAAIGRDEGSLVVADDGTNVARQLDFGAEGASLGLRMVGVLVKQIHGSVEVRRAAGTEVEVRFPLGEIAPVELEWAEA
ncbi:MAG: PAS domain S-box protein [Rhodospirillaceae bacterium]|nr:PAS domain S-box protein [Rhodospirillales bacterium]